jgi:hypothetical protein
MVWRRKRREKQMSGSIDKKVEFCEFDKEDGCHALACYSGEKCNSRDETENPMYAPLEIIKKEMKYQNDKRI